MISKDFHINLLISTNFINILCIFTNFRKSTVMNCWWISDDFLWTSCVLLCVRVYLWWVSDEFVGAFWKIDSGAGMLKLKIPNEICWNHKKYIIFLNLSDFWWVSAISGEILMSFWWASDDFLVISYCFIMCQIISLMSFWWVSVGSLVNFRVFLMSFWWVSVEFIWGDAFLMNCWWVSVEFRVFRFSTDSTKSQQNLNRNHRNSTEAQQKYNLTYGQSPY